MLHISLVVEIWVLFVFLEESLLELFDFLLVHCQIESSGDFDGLHFASVGWLVPKSEKNLANLTVELGGRT